MAKSSAKVQSVSKGSKIPRATNPSLSKQMDSNKNRAKNSSEQKKNSTEKQNKNFSKQNSLNACIDEEEDRRQAQKTKMISKESIAQMKKSDQIDSRIAKSNLKNEISFKKIDSISSIEYDEWNSPVQNIFLWFVSAIYFFAFYSFYIQIRGLYGDTGILPLKHYAFQLIGSNKTITLDALQTKSPSLVWLFAFNTGLSLTSSLEFIALLGIGTSFLQLLFDSFRCPINYLLLFILYGSCVNVGQTFLYFQWDTFLLEVGALTVLISKRSTGMNSFWNRFCPHPQLVLWTAKWLLFKFMLSSGVVKFTARCPLWWSLRALDVHFESQPLPTSLAWWIHRLPQNWLHFFVIVHFVMEIACPFIFFTPFKSFQILAFLSQILLQIAIFLTGNYNFFNMLTMILSITLLSDDLFRRKRIANQSTHSRINLKTIETICFGIFIGSIVYYTIYFFDIKFDTADLWNGPQSKINFTYDQFDLFVINCITISIALGVISLIVISIYSFYKCCSYGSFIGKLIHCITTTFYTILCAIILVLSIVPLSELDTTGQQSRTFVSKNMQSGFGFVQHHHIMSSYGLFRSMTGDGGRPELMIEVSNDDKWISVPFKYKPVDLHKPPEFVVPHQPRLDWQMWFAALSSYQNNPWLLHLSYRILTGSDDVLDLLDKNSISFQTPPKYLE
ncbi:Lipase maturation factor 2 [Sarcoptes scabiei]|uniref:Lipase maturation factor n=2 Tax=Sarcoptes scabiei TaxID=52283 RepID=A0A834VGZ9_SARSC|nr:Lipase maturation factor 2 [Sarcoptes scabiei]